MPCLGSSRTSLTATRLYDVFTLCPENNHYRLDQCSDHNFFCIYTLPLGEIMRRHGVEFHFFADDMQIYMSTSFPDLAAACTRIEHCISDIKSWMSSNFLKFNDDKTEMLLTCSRFSRGDLRSFSVDIAGTKITPSPKARNIGALFDCNFMLEAHVNQTCRSSYYSLCKIGAIRKYLTFSATTRLVHAFIHSKLDHLNSLLLNLPDCLLDRLQRIQNVAARIVTRSKRYEHITPILAGLHWLPVRARTVFKVCLLVYRTFQGQAPSYISDILSIYKPSRNLRSAGDGLLLDVPRTLTSTYGTRAFSAGSPSALE